MCAAQHDAALTDALGARYEVDDCLGRGAFGEVYRATDRTLNRSVAIKRIRLDRVADPSRSEEIRSRFLREAQVSAQLHHPNIVTVFDILTAGDTNFIVMEYVDGLTLAQKLRPRKPLSLEESVYIVSRVATALHHAHHHKVIHRDVKPGNILVSRAGDVKVTDFGVAKIESSNMTTAGVVLGTPDYMAPEQARGSAVDSRSDLFSLGCIFYECLAGYSPFHAKSLTGVLIRIVNDAPTPLDYEKLGLPSSIGPLLDRALEKDPERRFEDGAAFADALRSLPGMTRGGQAPRIETSAKGSDGVAAPDSVADSLMKEARRTTQIQPHLHALKAEKRRLGHSGAPLLQFRNVNLTPEEAYILSRIDGEVTPSDILAVSPLGEEQTARALLGFLRAGIVSLEGQGPDSTPILGGRESVATDRVDTVDEDTRREIERLYRVFQDVSQSDWKVLGLEPGSYDRITSAFQTQAFRFHPERYRATEETTLKEQVDWLFQRVSRAFANLTAESMRVARPAKGGDAAGTRLGES